MPKAYPPQKKAEVVALALAGELSRAQVAERAGVSSTTLFRWIKDSQPKRDNVSHLRAVPDAEQEPAQPARRPTVSEAAETGTTRELLVATRTRIAKAVEDPNTPARDLAALTKRLFEVVRDIEAIDARDEEAGSAGDVPDAKFDASAI